METYIVLLGSRVQVMTMPHPLRLLPWLLALLSPIVSATGASTLVVAFGESLEPYVMPADKSGIEVEIVREALKSQSITMQPVFLSQKRLPLAFSNREIDAISTIVPDSGIEGAYSDVYIHYEDKAITLASRKLSLSKVGDLARFSVLAFPHAAKYLGPEFATLSQNHPNYRETGDQVDQNRTLYRGNVDVVVSDIRIFNYMDRRMQERFGESPKAVQYHDIFVKIPYRMLFRSPAMRDAFNKGLHQLQQSGRYQQILNRYR